MVIAFVSESDTALIIKKKTHPLKVRFFMLSLFLIQYPVIQACIAAKIVSGGFGVENANAYTHLL